MPDVDLDAVEARLDGERRRTPVVLDDALDPGNIDGAEGEPIGVNPPEGDKAGAPFERALATGPAWPICAAAATPSACTASVRPRSPGTVSRSSRRQCRSVRPSGETAR